MNEVKKPKKPLIYYYGIVLVALLLFNFLAVPWLSQRQVKEVDYGTFMTMTEEKQIGKVEVQDNQILFTDKEEKQVYKTGLMTDPDLVNRLKASGAEFSSEIQEQMSPVLSFLLSWLVPILFFVGIGQLMSKRMMSKFNGPNSMLFGGKNSGAKVYVKSSERHQICRCGRRGRGQGEPGGDRGLPPRPRANTSDIGATYAQGRPAGGPSGHRQDHAGQGSGRRGQRALLLHVRLGVRGDVRGHGRMPKCVTCSTRPRRKPPASCSSTRSTPSARSGTVSLGGNDEREQTLNQLLTEMDGFEDNTGVIILAATNRPESLDPALTRPGRFDRRVPVELPDLKGREAILKVHAKKVKLADDVDFQKPSPAWPPAPPVQNWPTSSTKRPCGPSGTAASAPPRRTWRRALRWSSPATRKRTPSSPTRRSGSVAYHEIGHALVAAKQTHSAPVQKITIIPRTSGALGYTMQVEEGNHYLMTKEEIENKIATLTGGRAAEELIFGSITTGASNDIEQATKLARAMITRYGMSEDFDMVALETVNNQYLGGDAALACSAETQAEIDRQVVSLVKNQHQKAHADSDGQSRRSCTSWHSYLLREGDHHWRRIHADFGTVHKINQTTPARNGNHCVRGFSVSRRLCRL